jgi:Tol biopolymer transport system component
MKNRLVLLVLILGILLVGCAQPTELPPTDPPPTHPPTNTPTEPPPPTATEIPPTETPVPSETPIPTETPIPSPTPYDGPPRIVFSSNRGADPTKMGLFIIAAETKEITQVETGFDDNFYPRWSRDGNAILFSVPGVFNLYSIKPDGTELTQITDFRSFDGDWSADGTQVVFQSDHQNEPENIPDIYTLDITGENKVELVDIPEQLDFAPRWSPVRDQIAFISSRSGNIEIYVMNADGTDPVQITDSKAPIYYADWSPDGERLVFVYGQGKSHSDLYIVNKDGDATSVVRLTSDTGWDDRPSFSPDGQQVVYHSNKGGDEDNDLWIINADGSGDVQLTDDKYNDHYPDWSP